ncbi:MAG: CoA pyrophosphatase [Alphaproteobacteria bacterium]
MTRTRIIERLSGLKPGLRGFGGTSDPVEAAAFRRELQDDRALNPGLVSTPSTALRPAAVLVPLIDHPPGHRHGMTVLLTQRTAHLTAHAGQISFPGGRIETQDPDPESAALRETEEEVGLPRDRVRLIGRLDTYLTGTGFEITPVVGIVSPPFPLAIDPFEVAEAFEVPLSYILDRRNHQRVERQSGAHRRVFYVLPYEGRNIWGATAGILVNLAEVLAE